MHILIAAISRSTRPSGLCRHAANLVRSLALQAETTRITLLIAPWQSRYFTEAFQLHAPMLTITVASVENKPLARNLWYRNTLPRLASTLQADIVHLTYPVPLQRRRFRVPVVVSLHDLYPYDEPRNFGYPQVFANRLILRQCLHNADSIACVSASTHGGIHRRMPAEARRACIIPNCIEITTPAATNSPFRSALPARFLLCVAQHRANKNIQCLLHAFVRLLRRAELDPAMTLVIVGSEGPETSALHTLVHRFSLEKSILFLDNLADAELLWLYRNCELVISPSRTEGFSLPVAEALLYGARVVCSDIPAHREIARDTAEYFDPCAVDAEEGLSLAITTALARPVQSARESLVRFSAHHVGRQYLDLYQSLLKSSSSGSGIPMPTNYRGTAQANILGIGIHAVDMNAAADVVASALQSGQRGIICMTGVHGIMEAQRDPAMRSIYANALLVAPDGMPTVWIGRLQGHRGMRRVFGPDLMLEVMSRPEFRDRTHFLCGGDPGVAEELRDKLLQRMSHLKIVGTYMPPFRPMTALEEEQLRDMVQAAKPDIMWVGLGTPLQEKFMADHIGILDARLMFGVGAAFNYHTGRLADSPEWVKQIGMQWFHRLLQEPQRLWKRYLVNNTLFVLYIALQFLGFKHSPLEHAGQSSLSSAPGQRSL